MNNFIAFTRPDGTIEYRHPNYSIVIKPTSLKPVLWITIELTKYVVEH